MKYPLSKMMNDECIILLRGCNFYNIILSKIRNGDMTRKGEKVSTV